MIENEIKEQLYNEYMKYSYPDINKTEPCHLFMSLEEQIYEKQ